MAYLDQTVRQTRRVLSDLAKPAIPALAGHQPVDGDPAYAGRAGTEATP
jgi:hypothetical protein